MFSNLAEPLSHELIELGIMDYCLKHLASNHKEYILQHLANYNVSDFLVYMVQLEQLEDNLTADEKHQILIKAFSFGTRLIVERGKILSVFSEQDPLASEIEFYSELLEVIFKRYQELEPGDTRKAMQVFLKEASERTASDNKFYDNFIEKFIKSFNLSVRASFYIQDNLKSCLLVDSNGYLLN